MAVVLAECRGGAVSLRRLSCSTASALLRPWARSWSWMEAAETAEGRRGRLKAAAQGALETGAGSGGQEKEAATRFRAQTQADTSLGLLSRVAS